ncbi:acyltransferase [Pseudoclavibacter sp. CFCC 14310]|uniref:acyltransferase family protein n=1 Tax=Pseudoclavibacter sp. CFCC 14310 TaxID=2615180 RepID=UPI0013015459|nr:acyltransferase family protein [Pseudoclavibacter sp. CFCC 14310]KAB1647032.1 acyltransferase [Pseudoclavibacter sp. CFCC 14310]
MPRSPLEEAAPKPHYRKDVQGLRAVAALLVAVYHIWFHRVSGAVDLFFFISAFFMTTSLLRRFAAQETRPAKEIRRFWGNLMKRMLPQAWAVLVFTLVAAWAITPMTWWRQLIDEFIGAATFTVNWVLAANGNDYLHAGDIVSPVQHYWAMAVQLQVYLVWPLLIWAFVWLARKLKRNATAMTAVGLAVVGVSSLAYSIYLTGQNQPVAYYDTFTRVWEFAAGALFAIALPHIRLPRVLRFLAGWVGLLGLLCFGMVLNVSASFPGIVAAVPLTFAALIFLADDTGSRFGTDRLLASRPLVWLGGISYGIYLWHWPLMNLWLAHNDQAQLTFPQGVVVVELAIVLAWLTTRFIEAPIRHSSVAKPFQATDGQTRAAVHPRRKLKLLTPSRFRLAALGLTLVLAITTWAGSVSHLTKKSDGTQNPGAAALTVGYDGPQIFTRLSPSLTTLTTQWPEAIGECSRAAGTDNGQDCRNSVSAAQSTLRIAAVGDSHTATWMTALAPQAEAQGWALRQLHMDMCPFERDGDAKLDPSDTASVFNCARMNDYRMSTLTEQRPDVVFTSANLSQPDSPAFVLGHSFADTVKSLTAQGIAVIMVRDTPRYVVSQNDCAARLAKTPDLASTACTTDRSLVLDSRPFDELLPKELTDDPLVATMDLSSEFCPENSCPAAIGGVVTYIDNNHPTRQYIASLSSSFDDQFTSALHELFPDRDITSDASDSSLGHEDPLLTAT